VRAGKELQGNIRISGHAVKKDAPPRVHQQNFAYIHAQPMVQFQGFALLEERQIKFDFSVGAHHQTADKFDLQDFSENRGQLRRASCTVRLATR
jgi:hypothetical protein